MVQQVTDYTVDFNKDAKVQFDTSGWDYAIFQIVSPTGSITFKSTNDAGAVQGVTDGNATLATNFVTTYAIDLSSSTGALAASTSVSGIYKYQSVGRFIQLAGANGTTVTKLLVQLSKIH
jgi:hypothetical protein